MSNTDLRMTCMPLPNGIDKVLHMGGSILFHGKGVVSLLEVYTYTDELWSDLLEYRLYTLEQGDAS